MGCRVLPGWLAGWLAVAAHPCWNCFLIRQIKSPMDMNCPACPPLPAPACPCRRRRLSC